MFLIVALHLYSLTCAMFCVDTTGVQILSGASLYLHPGASLHISTSVNNHSMIGSYNGSQLIFSGRSWIDSVGVKYPGDGGPGTYHQTGGNFIFRTPVFGAKTQWLQSAGTLQSIQNGSSSFPNLFIDNPDGVRLIGLSAMGIRNRLHFEKGCLFLASTDLYIGTEHGGVISGYNENSYVKTERSSASGFLYRRRLQASSNNIVFPIGASLYTPLSIMINSDTLQDIRAKVFDSVFAEGVTGKLDSDGFVKNTWMIGTDPGLRTPAILAIQHMSNRETPQFNLNRTDSYITEYSFARSVWDTIPSGQIHTPGSITTGAPIVNSYTHTRSTRFGNQALLYLSKSIAKASKSFVLAKSASNPLRNPDNSYTIVYTLILNNVSNYPIENLSLIDSLSKVFSPQQTYQVLKVTATGELYPDPGYDGRNRVNLLLLNSRLNAHKTDTVRLTLQLIPNGVFGAFYNTAGMNGFSNTPAGQTVISAHSINGSDASSPNQPPSPTMVTLNPGKIIIPGGFSPNGDGVNDYFTIPKSSGTKVRIEVFNRYGKIVYKSNDYQNDWNGISNQSVLFNQKLTVGTYYYTVTMESQSGSEKYVGYLSIWY